MSYHLHKRLLSWYKTGRDRGLIAVFAVVALLGIAVTIFDYQTSKKVVTGGLLRNVSGERERVEELRAEAGEFSENIEITVSERAYTEKEMQEVFDECIRKMDTWILGENKSPDRVESDLKLITEIPGEPVDVSWELDRYDVMNIYGEIQEGKPDKDGTLVTLKAVLTYRERQEAQALYECRVMVYPKTLKGREAFVKRIREKIEEEDENTKTEAVLELPEEVDGETVYFYPVMDTRGLVLLAMAALMPVFFYALDRQNKEKMAEERHKQLKLDYPEIVSKLTLLLGAGMTVKRAWKKITEDAYKRGGEHVRYVYEEMRYTCREMEGGVMESEGYERFGRRCGLQEYIRLGALLSQNLRKGTKGMNDLLRLEAMQAFEERKARAKRLGEEAGTKLLMPMFLMLAVVLVIVIIPAFLSVQL